MKKQSLFSILFSLFLIIIVLSIGASAVYSITTFSHFIDTSEKNHLIENTEILLNLFPKSKLHDVGVIREFTDSSSGRSIRITVTDSKGKVLADSIESPELMENHLDRPEIRNSVNGIYKPVLRYSSTIQETMIYYSLPIVYEDETIGYLRTAISVETLKHRIQVITITVSIISLILIIISAFISYIIALKFSLSINSIKRVANYYSKGKFERSLPEKGPREIALLSKSINVMGSSLKDILNKAVEQKNRYKSMLESMREPVIRLNKALIVEEINSSAELLFKVKNKKYKGLGIMEITHNEQLFTFVKNSLTEDVHSETIVQFNGESETHLQVHSSLLYSGDKKIIGILLVMNDLTEHIRLEEMQKEFVANVSHELRTPTTAIQGYIETLQNNDVSMEQVDKFLGIINSHSIRLTSIIDDLLVLAGLEKSNESFVFENFPVVDLISSAVNTVTNKAEKKGIKIGVYSSERHMIYAHPLLAEQALTNLLVNAIKYSGEGTCIEVKTYTKKEGITLEVSDQGNGIPKEDQEQIFERFYRVDRARSRDQGGTGLGLSIVKRVMSIHDGEATMSSELNIGSVFRLFFPVE